MSKYDGEFELVFLIAVVAAIMAIAGSLMLLNNTLEDINPPPVTLMPMESAQ